MLDYNNINKLFGAPLNTVARPSIPFRIKKWHLALGLGIIALASYGGYKLYQNYIKDSKKEYQQVMNLVFKTWNKSNLCWDSHKFSVI